MEEREVSDEFTFFYWPGILGRGEFVRLVLEGAGVQYRDIGREEGMAAVVEGAGIGGTRTANAPFAPPYLRHGDTVVFQTANICAYLGLRLDLAPETEKDRHFALGVALTVEDFVREIHDTHHPIAVSKYYEDQKPEAMLRAEDFRSNRMPTFLQYFETLIETNPSQSEWLGGEELTYCDLSLFQVVEGLRYAFPNALLGLVGDIERTTELVERVRNHERIAAYLESDRRLPFNQDGIFRHYPELDI